MTGIEAPSFMIFGLLYFCLKIYVSNFVKRCCFLLFSWGQFSHNRLAGRRSVVGQLKILPKSSNSQQTQKQKRAFWPGSRRPAISILFGEYCVNIAASKKCVKIASGSLYFLGPGQFSKNTIRFLDLDGPHLAFCGFVLTSRPTGIQIQPHENKLETNTLLPNSERCTP